MTNDIAIQVGKVYRFVDSETVPPIGTRIMIQDCLTDEGSTEIVEIVGHDWQLKESLNEEGERIGTYFQIRLKTKIVQ